MGQIRLLCLIKILQKSSRGKHSHRKLLDSQPHQRTNLKMPQQNPFTALVIKEMCFQRIHRNVIPALKLFHGTAHQECLIADHLRRLILHQLIIQFF